MASWSFPLPPGTTPRCATFDPARNIVWIGTAAGDVVSYRLVDGTHLVRGSGYGDPVAVVLAPDGLSLHVVEAAGGVFSVFKDEAGRARAAPVAMLGQAVVGAAMHPDDTRLLVLTAAGTLRAIDLATGTPATVAGGFTDPVALSVDAASGLAVILDDVAGGLELRPVALDTGNAGAGISVDAGTTALLAGQFGGAAALTASGPAGSLSLIGLEGQPAVLGEDVGMPVVALARWESLVLGVAATSIEAREWALATGPLTIELPIAPLFTGGYARAEIDLAGAGLGPADVPFAIEEGPAA
ncbi:MAG: hypothetical protein H0V24_07645, partial [Chloroflexia bacterium]|nr:hypothetical protein [Chloroflexia bacterium]